MHTNVMSHFQRVAGACLLALAAVPALSAQSRVVLPAGTVIIGRTTAPLRSATAQVGQTFELAVEDAIGVDGYAVIPSGSRIRGRVTVARPATRQESGVIEVVFDRLRLSNGTVFPLVGKLTSTDSAERRQIRENGNARVALVGGRGGIGAAIAGAGAGSGSGNLLAALGGLLSEGRDVDVPAGTPLAVELQRALALRGRGRMRAADASTIYTAPERVRAAQQALARLNYYRGRATGTLDDATRRALFAFQSDRALGATGNLDGRTLQALGLDAAGGLTGMVLSAEEASQLRRDAQTIVARYREEIGIATDGRLDPRRTYSQGEIELWFAVSAFADNTSTYELVVRNGGKQDAALLAGRSLRTAMRRVDAALREARTSPQMRDAWSTVRRELARLEDR